MISIYTVEIYRKLSVFCTEKLLFEMLSKNCQISLHNWDALLTHLWLEHHKKTCYLCYFDPGSTHQLLPLAKAIHSWWTPLLMLLSAFCQTWVELGHHTAAKHLSCCYLLLFVSPDWKLQTSFHTMWLKYIVDALLSCSQLRSCLDR